MAQQTIQCGAGSVNFAKCSAKWSISVLAPPKIRTQISRLEGVEMLGKPFVYPAGPDMDITGRAVLQTLKMSDATTLIIEAMYFQSGALFHASSMFIRTRSNGPLTKIITRSPASADSKLPDFWPLFLGRADILTLEEMKMLKYEFGDVFDMRHRNKAHSDYCFTVDQDKTALKTNKPTIKEVVGNDGQKKVVVLPPRMIRQYRP